MNRFSKFDVLMQRIIELVRRNYVIRIYRNVAGLIFAVFIISAMVLVPMLCLFSPYYQHWFELHNFNNKKIEIIKEVLLENMGNKQVSTTISIPNDNPKIMNYYYTAIGTTYSLTPYKHTTSTDYFQLSVPGHSRKFVAVRYTSQLDSRIDITNTDITTGVKRITPQSFDPSATESNKEIVNTAKRITQGEANPYNKAETILEYVINHMTYTYNYKYAHTGASAAFSTGQGVCEEYAGLYTVMAQAAGLPCRYDYGVRISELTNSFQPITAEHAWPEILLKNGRWVPIEATQNGPSTKRSVDWLKANLDRAFKNSFGIYIRMNISYQVRPKGNSRLVNTEILLTKEL